MACPHRIKTYKVRLNRWGFSKYITDKFEREALQQLVSSGLQRRGLSKSDTFQLKNGTVVSLSNLATHLERKKSIAFLYPMSMIRSPDDLWISEEMLVNAREYIRRQYANQGHSDKDIRASLPSHYGDFFKGFVAVRRLLQEAKIDDALLVLRRAPEQIRLLLSPETVNNAFGCICITVLCIKWDESRAGYMNATLRALMKYAASVVQENAGPDPLRRILTSLTKLDDAIFREAVIRTWRCQLQTWTSIIEPYWSIPLLGEWLAFAETAGHEQLPRNLDQGVRDTIRRHEVQYGRSSQSVLTLLWLQGEYERLYFEKRSLSSENAEVTFLDLLERGTELDVLGKYTAQYFLAKEYRSRGDKENAEIYLRRAIDSACALKNRPCYGISASLELMFDLEKWLTEWGEHEKAKDVHMQLSNMRLAHEQKAILTKAPDPLWDR